MSDGVVSNEWLLTAPKSGFADTTTAGCNLALHPNEEKKSEGLIRARYVPLIAEAQSRGTPSPFCRHHPKVTSCFMQTSPPSRVEPRLVPFAWCARLIPCLSFIPNEQLHARYCETASPTRVCHPLYPPHPLSNSQPYGVVELLDAKSAFLLGSVAATTGRGSLHDRPRGLDPMTTLC